MKIRKPFNQKCRCCHKPAHPLFEGRCEDCYVDALNPKSNRKPSAVRELATEIEVSEMPGVRHPY
jgi:hypothetical protein